MMPINRSLGFEALGIVALAIWPLFGVFAQLEPDPWSQLHAPFVRDQRARPEYPWITDKAKQQKDVFARPDSNLTLIGLWPWGPCTAVAARDHYAFIGNGGLFQVFDLSNPAQPQILSEVFLGQSLAYDIKLKGNFAFVADGNLKVIDISDPARPQRVAALYLPETFAVRILISGDYAYVGSLGAIVSIVDISTPTSPFVKNTFRLSDDFVKNMAIYENHLFIKTEHPLAPIYIIDVSDRDHPRLAGYYGDRHYNFAIQDHYLYLSHADSGLQIVDITKPATPKAVSRLATPFAGPIIVQDTLAYVIAGKTLLAIINIADVFNCFIVGTAVGDPGANAGLAVAPPSVIASNNIGFWTIDISHLDRPEPLTFFTTGNAAVKIQVVNNLAYLACLQAGLFIVDITNSSNLQFVGNFSIGGWTDDVIVVDSLAYLSGYPFDPNMPPQLSVVSIIRPNQPQIVAQVPLLTERPQGGLYPTALDLSGNYAFVTHNLGLSIVDVSEKCNPRFVKLIPTTRVPFDVAIMGHFVCLANAELGLRIFDISDPKNPQEKAAFPGFAAGVTSRLDTLFVALGGGITIFKILLSGSVIKLGEATTPGSRTTVDIALAGHFAYMAYNEDLVVVDISNPLQPQIVSQVITPASAWSVAAKSNEIYVAGGVWALQIYKNNLITRIDEEQLNHIPLSPRLYLNFPNPFNSSTTIQYEIPRAGKVELNIFNSLAKEISQLVNGWQSAGKYHITFDANNLAAGVYFCRLRFNDWQTTQKILILR